MKPETAKALGELARAAYIHQYGFEPADGEITFAVCGTERDERVDEAGGDEGDPEADEQI